MGELFPLAGGNKAIKGCDEGSSCETAEMGSPIDIGDGDGDHGVDSEEGQDRAHLGAKPPSYDKEGAEETKDRSGCPDRDLVICVEGDRGVGAGNQGDEEKKEVTSSTIEGLKGCSKCVESEGVEEEMGESGVEKACCDQAVPLAFCDSVDLAITQDLSIEEEEMLFKVGVDQKAEIDRNQDQDELIGYGVIDPKDHRSIVELLD